jgi:hypothetical protein
VNHTSLAGMQRWHAYRNWWAAKGAGGGEVRWEVACREVTCESCGFCRMLGRHYLWIQACRHISPGHQIEHSGALSSPGPLRHHVMSGTRAYLGSFCWGTLTFAVVGCLGLIEAPANKAGFRVDQHWNMHIIVSSRYKAEKSSI